MKRIFVVIFNKFSKMIQSLANWILLHLIYLVGFGITSLISKLMRKRFLDSFPKDSAWSKPTGSDDLNKMF